MSGRCLLFHLKKNNSCRFRQKFRSIRTHSAGSGISSFVIICRRRKFSLLSSDYNIRTQSLNLCWFGLLFTDHLPFSDCFQCWSDQVRCWIISGQSTILLTCSLRPLLVIILGRHSRVPYLEYFAHLSGSQPR